MPHFEPQANGYEEALIRDSTVSVISRLYQRERRKVCKRAKAKLSRSLALLRAQTIEG
jgi:hypothetical protein